MGALSLTIGLVRESARGSGKVSYRYSKSVAGKQQNLDNRQSVMDRVKEKTYLRRYDNIIEHARLASLLESTSMLAVL